MNAKVSQSSQSLNFVFFLSIVFLFYYSDSFAQTKKTILVFDNPTDSTLFFKECIADVAGFRKVEDSVSMLVQLKTGIQTAQKKGFLTAALDSFNWQPTPAFAKIHVGKKYELTQLNTQNIPPEYLIAIDFNEKRFVNQPINQKFIASLEEKLLQQAENNGFPFARVRLENIKFSDTLTEKSTNHISTTADLILSQGKLFRFDTLRIVGNGKINSRFLNNFLEMKRGTPFSRNYLTKLSGRISELPYLNQTRTPTVSFDAVGRASVNLFVDNKKASRFDFLLGVQPTTGADGSQKFTITFNGTGDFQNFLGWGERFYANFENLRPQSPRVDIKVSLPYIPKMVFGIDAGFDLYKRDTTYIETKSQLGITYYLGSGQTAKFFWQNNSANNLLLDTSTIISTHRLPPTLDYNTNSIGLEFLLQRLDYRYNPRKGWFLSLRGSAGLRNVQKNTDILNLKDSNDTSFRFASLYDTVSTTAYQYRIETETNYFQPIGKRSTLKLGITSGSLLSSSLVGANEQYRIGGNKILRGFDEESIFATQFVAGTLEYRFLIGRNSYLYTFCDGAFVNNSTRTQNSTDTPVGIGAGITIETKVGLFGVTLAAGSQQRNGIDFRNIKTHFGYVSYF